MLNPPATGIMQEADSAELLPGQQVDRVSILNARRVHLRGAYGTDGNGRGGLCAVSSNIIGVPENLR